MLAADVKSGDPEKLAETLDGVTRQTLLVCSHFAFAIIALVKLCCLCVIIVEFGYTQKKVNLLKLQVQEGV